MANKTRQQANLVSNGNIFSNTTNNKVGIGTTNPISKLSVSGDGYFVGVVTATSFIGDGSGLTGAGSTVADDTSTNGTFYPVLTQTTSGTITASKVSTTKLSFNPSTGTVSATGFSGSGASLTNLNASNLSSGVVPAARITSTSALNVGGDLYVSGNISFGGTTTQLNTSQLTFSDPDIVLGVGTTSTFNPTDNTANHGGIAIASTEGSPLVNLNIDPAEVLPSTYKKIMWFKNNTAGLGTDAWLSNYAVGIGSTQFPTGTRFASGTIQFGQSDINVVRNINSSGVVTATTFSGSGASLTGVPVSTGISGLGANVATFLATPSSSNLAAAVTDETGSGALVFATSPTLTTPNIGAATGTSLSVSGVSTASRFVSSVATGTAPLSVTSTTLCTNLNADYVDGYQVGTSGATIPLLNASNTWSGSQYFTSSFSAEATTKADITTRTASGFWQDGGSATTAEGWPVTTNTWYHLISCTHSNTGNYYAMQFAGDFYNSNDIYYRSTNGSGTTGWNKMWHAGNDGSGSGLDADLLDGLNSASTNTASTIVARDASGNFNASNISLSGNLTVSTGNATGGGIILADDGDIVDNNDGYCSMRFSSGVRVFSGNKTGSAVITLGSNGNITATGNVTAYSSDRRLKENFNHIETPLEKVQKLNGYTFDWNKKSEELGFTPQYKKNDVGLIAQEVQAVLPQAAVLAPFDRDTNEDGETVSKSGENYLTIQYERLVPLLVEAIKEQQEQINTLKEEINNLKK